MLILSSYDEVRRHAGRDGDFSLTRTEGVVFPRTRLPNLAGGMFVGCDFSGARFVEADLSQALFIDCKMEAAQFTDCDLFDAEFVRCALNAAYFRHCDLSAARFKACRLDGSDFPDCAMEAAELGGFIPASGNKAALILPPLKTQGLDPRHQG